MWGPSPAERAPSAMGRLFLEHLDGPCYRCRRCQAHLAKASELISKVSGRLPAAANPRLLTSQHLARRSTAPMAGRTCSTRRITSGRVCRRSGQVRCPRQSLCRLALTLARLARSPPPSDDGPARGQRHQLRLLRRHRGLGLRALPVSAAAEPSWAPGAPLTDLKQVEAHEKSQKYKEGKVRGLRRGGTLHCPFDG